MVSQMCTPRQRQDGLLGAQNDASEVGYDNSDSGLAATNVKTGLDELDGTVAGIVAGSLDTRYYTEAEVDTKLEAADAAAVAYAIAL